MFGTIARFLLHTIFTLFGTALLLRAWFPIVKLTPYSPLLQAIFQATNWLVVPLRRIIPASRCIDWTSLFAAWLSAIIFVVMMVVASGGNPALLFPVGFVIATLTMIKWVLNLIILLTLIMTLLLWFNPLSPAIKILLQLTTPLFHPIRRVIPQLGRIDFSPLILIIIIEILLIIITHITVSVITFRF
ncbi:YggT family protein [Candidatus Vallotia tarda]|uniref:YggT family protein n=1 Tax=Candidatus Vallotiella hemipterorum TaxID=1177213 RepID=A0A916JTV0_9BURK|nr:YggT family protein [Candidatus Vallotia tarda]CAG7597869.1 YggT family protein [Candidatus Vallotia tarda]